MNKKFIRIIFIAVIFLAVGIGSYIFVNFTRNKDDGEKLKIIVSILPQKEFVKAIGGDLVDVTELVHPGESPESYTLTSQDLVEVADADIYFKVGQVAFEKANADKISEANSDLMIVDTSTNVELRYFTESEEHEHEEETPEELCENVAGVWSEDYSECLELSNEDECEYVGGTFDDCASACRHTGSSTCTEQCVKVCTVEEVGHEEEVDPHLWLSPTNVMDMIDQIYQALISADPDNESYYKANANYYYENLKTLDNTLKGQLSSLSGTKMLVFHPAWGYFADDYGLTQVAIEEDGKEPTAEGIQEIVNLINSEGIKVIFVQTQFDTKSAESIASDTGATVVQIDPLAENYIENMQSIGSTIYDNLTAKDE